MCIKKVRERRRWVRSVWSVCLQLITLLAAGCRPAGSPPVHTPVFTPPVIPSATAIWTPEPMPAATLTLTSTLTSIPTETPWPEPAGCLRPPDDYELVTINGWTINRRTYAMLEHAADLYGGEIEITGWAITQGSYHDNGSLSFGTHLGGGAVDLAVMRTHTWEIVYDELEPLVYALRQAGLAAWLRDFDEVYFGSAIHIHAIAIGDRELSQAAREQLTGTYGYFKGYNGLPQQSGVPVADPHGGPVICRWMVEEGFID